PSLAATGRQQPLAHPVPNLPRSPEAVPVRTSTPRRWPRHGESPELPPDRLAVPSSRFCSSWGSPFLCILPEETARGATSAGSSISGGALVRMPDILTRVRFEQNVTTFDHRDASWPSPECRGDARAGTKRCSAVAARC